jgi:hypothetical protein
MGRGSPWTARGVYQRGEGTNRVDVDLDGVTARELGVAVRRSR